MIQLCDRLQTDALPNTWQGTYCANRLSAYGLKETFAPFYTDGQTVLSVLDGNAVLCGDMVSPDEWADFLRICPDIQIVNMSFSQAVDMGERWQLPVTKKPVMQLQQRLPLPQIPLTNPSPRELYPLLQEVFGDSMPPFDNWYVDISHKMRHGLCRTIAVIKDGKPISCAMTVALSDKTAVIGAVATAPSHRRQGLAAQCLSGLVADLRVDNPNRQILISPKNIYAQQLYADLGFTECDAVGCIHFK